MFIPWAAVNQWCKKHLKVRIVSLKRLKYLNGALSKAMSIAFGAVQRLVDPGDEETASKCLGKGSGSSPQFWFQKMPEPKPSYQK